MSASVTFRCVQGPLEGKQFAYTERASFLIGRAEDCAIRIPRTEETMEVSRHHCLVEISPPLARIRDFGSLNGTYLNGERIGSRDPSQQPGDVSPDSPQRDLADGDTITLSNVTFEVAIESFDVCEECNAEIPKEKRDAALMDGQRLVCDACRARMAEQKRREEEAARQREQQAAKARQDAEAARQRAEQAKKAAQADEARKAAQPAQGKPGIDPMALVKALLEQARQGAPDVQNIRGYSILKTLGKGGMGAVYLARKDDTGQEVALKVMLPQVAANKDAVARFRREMDNATALRHPNIVESYESGYANNVFYLTMEVCNAGSVQDLQKEKGGKLPFDQAVTLMLQAFDGMEYMHSATIPNVRLANGGYGQGKGLVHRDIKPANLFLNRSGDRLTVKVADLGLAKAFDQAGLSGLTMTGQAAGSPPFMPRQQVIDYLHAKPEVDVWAIAATFYNLLTGAFPRDFAPGKDIWLAILQSDPVPIRQRDASIPAKLAAVIDRALVDKPRIGFSTIHDFHREVLKAL